MLLTGGIVLTFGEDPKVIPSGAVCYQDDTIVDVGFTSELTARYPKEEQLDVEGRIIMPGLICGHTHFYGAFARGMSIPGAPATNFVEILERLWWKIDRALGLEESKYSALVALVDAIRHGTTTLIDHHASPDAIDGSLDAVAEAVTEAGVRASLCYEVTDRNGPEGAAAGLNENVRFAKRLQNNPNPRLAASFGLHASLTLSDETLAQAYGYAKELGLGLHVHVAEDKADQADSLKRYNMRVVERFEKLGALGPKSIAVHCVHIDAYEMDILRQTRTHVTHQPRSNMNNAVGVADIEGMLRRGINVCLGNDGFSNNMFVEMHTTYLLHKLHKGDPRAMPADQVIRLAFENNRKLAAVFFEKPVGVLAPGAYADIIILDYYPYTPLTEGNFLWHIIFGVDGSQVTHTIAGGKMLMKEGELLTLDEEAIAARSRELAPHVWKRVSEM